MTNPGLAAINEACFSTIFGAGLADSATFYVAGDGVGIPCTVLVDRAIEYTDQTTGAPAHGTIVTANRYEIGPNDPPLKSFFAIGRERFVIDRLVESNDESLMRALCTVQC